MEKRSEIAKLYEQITGGVEKNSSEMPHFTTFKIISSQTKKPPRLAIGAAFHSQKHLASILLERGLGAVAVCCALPNAPG